jgi:hypothetical protein
MTTSVTDKTVDAAMEAYWKACGDEGNATGMRAVLKAALRSQGKVVSTDALQGLCDEWENMKVPRSADIYELGMFDGYRGAVET